MIGGQDRGRLVRVRLQSVEQLTVNVRSGLVVEFRCLDLVCALGLKYTRIHIPLCICHELFPGERERERIDELLKIRLFAFFNSPLAASLRMDA